VTLPHALIEGPLTWPGQHAGFLGNAHDPMLVTQDPNSPNFRMDTFTPAAGLDSARLGERKRLLDCLDSSGMRETSFRSQQDKAFEILTSRKVSGAFQLDHETDRVRDRYGRNQFGQTLLLSRRLVEAGVPVIQANMGIVQSWDTHADNWGRLKNRLLPWLDRAIAALLDDLRGRGLLEDTLVAVLGEFGRTPKISNLPGEPIPGRDHWAAVYSGLFTGAGVKGGRVIGKSDRVGAHPVTPAYTPFDVGATIYQSLGIDPQTEIHDATKRPTRVNDGKAIEMLFRDV
jgi:hypothetical protein